MHSIRDTIKSLIKQNESKIVELQDNLDDPQTLLPHEDAYLRAEIATMRRQNELLREALRPAKRTKVA